MPFNLYFAGWRSRPEDEVLKAHDVLRLLSYMNDLKRLLEWFDGGRKAFVDSGAFTAHTKGIEVPVDDYTDFLNQHDDHVIIAAQVDTIPGRFGQPKTRQEIEEAPEKSWQNYLYMRGRMKSPDKLLPIFHQGEDFKHLRRMLEFEPKIQYIGVSPANDVSTREKEIWIAEVFRIIKESPNPDVKTHAFGMTSLRVLEKFPFTSADSTTWLQLGVNGSIMTEFGPILLSNNQRTDPAHFSNQSFVVQQKIIQHLRLEGYDINPMFEDTKARNAWNIHFLTLWAQNYRYKPARTLQRGLF